MSFEPGSRRAVRLATATALFLLWATGGHADSLPAWVSSPPGDSPNAWFGVGEGDSVDSATSQALASLAGRLATRVLSAVKIDQHSEQSDAGGSYREDIESLVETQVEDTKLSHYQLKESKKSDGRYYALVELSIDKMVASNQADLRDHDTRVRQLAARRAMQSRMQRILAEPELYRALAEAESSLLVLRSLQPGFDDRQMADYLALRDAAEKDRNAIRTVVETDETSRVFAQGLANQLNARGFHSRVGQAGADEAVVRVRGSVDNHEAFGIKQTTLTLTLTTLDEQRAQLASVQRKKQASASGTHAMALKIAAREMVRDAERQDPLEYLGLVQRRDAGAF